MTQQLDVEIRLAVESDVPRILEVVNWAAEHSPAHFAHRPEPLEMWVSSWQATHERYPWLVARRGGTVAGFAKAGPHKTRAAYAWTAETSVYIDPEFHGRGIGTALYATLIPLLQSQGYPTLIAGVTTGNDASERLHAGAGFKPCGVFHRVGWKFERWHDVAYYEMHLQAADRPPGPIRPVAEVWAELSTVQGTS